MAGAAAVAAGRLPAARVGASAGRGTQAPAVAEVPGLPGVALDETEAPRVRREPPVRRRRPEIELGAEPVKRPAGWRDPLRVWVSSEQARLLGIRAEAARDRELEPRPVGGRGEP